MEMIELKNILALHEKWLNEEEGGERADLHGADLDHICLDNVDFRNANLREVSFRDAVITNSDFRGADLYEADFRFAFLQGSDFSAANLKDADFTCANLCNADFFNADLMGSDLKEANIKGVDFDYACLPLWCGSLNAHFDDKQLKQIAYHLVKAGLQSKNASYETKEELKKLIPFANGFHRAEDCGLIKENDE